MSRVLHAKGTGSSPNVTRSPLATDRRRQVEVRGSRCPEDHHVAVFIGGSLNPLVGPHERLPEPSLPPEARVEVELSRSKCAELEPGLNVVGHRRDHAAPETAAAPVGPSRDGFDVAGTK